MDLLRKLSFSAAIAGFVAVLVGFTSSAAIVFQAAQAVGAGQAEAASWMWALGLGMGASCIGLSLRYRVPVVAAWSTPGAAMLITAAAGLPMADAVGAFMVSSLLIAACGFGGWFERIVGRLPIALGSGMLAGVLLRFGLDVFTAMQRRPPLVLAMFLAWLLARRWLPRYAVMVTLAVGVAVAAGQGLLHAQGLHLALARPVFTMPHMSVAAVVGVALPLFVVTMASQNLPGIAILRAHGYGQASPSALVGWTGAAGLLLAPFGAFAINLAAISAAICMGPEAHEDPARRYPAAVVAGICYLLVGLFGATVAALFAALPTELVLAIAGIALFGTIGQGLVSALVGERDREAALITFLVTASGVSAAGIGSAFWGLVAGVMVLSVLRAGRRAEATRPSSPPVPAHPDKN